MPEPPIRRQKMANVPGKGLVPVTSIKDDDLQRMTLRCTACGNTLEHSPAHIRKHKHLSVLVCKKCHDFYGEGTFSGDEAGDDYCRWCAEGGKLIGCDSCTSSFCEACIHRNFGRGEKQKINHQTTWNCYQCNKESIRPYALFCEVVLAYINRVSETVKEDKNKKRTMGNEKKTRRTNSEPISEEEDGDVSSSGSSSSESEKKCWLNLHFDKALLAVDMFRRTLKKMKFKVGQNSHSSQRVVKGGNRFILLLSQHIVEVNKVMEGLSVDLQNQGQNCGADNNNTFDNASIDNAVPPPESMSLLDDMEPTVNVLYTSTPINPSKKAHKSQDSNEPLTNRDSDSGRTRKSSRTNKSTGGTSSSSDANKVPKATTYNEPAGSSNIEPEKPCKSTLREANKDFTESTSKETKKSMPTTAMNGNATTTSEGAQPEAESSGERIVADEETIVPNNLSDKPDDQDTVQDKNTSCKAKKNDKASENLGGSSSNWNLHLDETTNTDSKKSAATRDTSAEKLSQSKSDDDEKSSQSKSDDDEKSSQSKLDEDEKSSQSKSDDDEKSQAESLNKIAQDLLNLETIINTDSSSAKTKKSTGKSKDDTTKKDGRLNRRSKRLVLSESSDENDGKEKIIRKINKSKGKNPKGDLKKKEQVLSSNSSEESDSESSDESDVSQKPKSNKLPKESSEKKKENISLEGAGDNRVPSPQSSDSSVRLRARLSATYRKKHGSPKSGSSPEKEPAKEDHEKPTTSRDSADDEDGLLTDFVGKISRKICKDFDDSSDQDQRIPNPDKESTELKKKVARTSVKKSKAASLDNESSGEEKVIADTDEESTALKRKAAKTSVKKSKPVILDNESSGEEKVIGDTDEESTELKKKVAKTSSKKSKPVNSGNESSGEEKVIADTDEESTELKKKVAKTSPKKSKPVISGNESSGEEKVIGDTDEENLDRKREKEDRHSLNNKKDKPNSADPDVNNDSDMEPEIENSEDESPDKPLKKSETPKMSDVPAEANQNTKLEDKSKNKSNKRSENEKAKRDLLEVLSSSDNSATDNVKSKRTRKAADDDSDLELSPRKTKKIKKVKKKLLADSSSDDDDIQLKKPKRKVLKSVPIEDDIKVVTQPVVMLQRLSEVTIKMWLNGEIKNSKGRRLGRRSRPVSSDIDEAIDNLGKLPSFPSPKSRKGLSPKKKVPIAAKKSKTVIDLSNSSDSEDCFDGDSDKTNKIANPKTKDPTVNLNDLAKDAILRGINSDESSGSDSEVTEKLKKPSKKKSMAAKKRKLDSDGSNGNSDDDFVVSKKKSRYEKILAQRLGSESDSTGSSSKIKKNKKKAENKSKKSGKKRVIRIDSGDEEKSTSNSDSSSDSDLPKKKAKKRKRIKVVLSDDSSANEDKDLPDTPSGKGRKNIRNILGKTSLETETKKAAYAEKERRKRVLEKQQKYNQVTEKSGDNGDLITRKLVLEVHKESKEELVEVPEELLEKLKPHQVNGVKFMWECVIESLERLEEDKKGSGCVLAHCMGLGKTLQVITFLSTLMTNKIIQKHIHTALVVCPFNTVLNWEHEFEHWLDNTDISMNVFELSSIKANADRHHAMSTWKKEGGVLIMSYDMFRTLSQAKNKSIPLKLRTSFQKFLNDPGPDIVICDEGHILKNAKTAIAKAMSTVRTGRRIVLTGTPLQNNLKEYHCMVHFVKPHLIGSLVEFTNRFVNPITNGQCTDSTTHDVKVMMKRTHILHKLLEGSVQRCDYSHVAKYLPPKHEYVISVRLSPVQMKLYAHYLETYARKPGGARAGSDLFKDFNTLRLIWTHPYVMQLNDIRRARKEMFEDRSDADEVGSLVDFIDDSTSASDGTSENDVACLDEAGPSKPKKKSDDGSGSDSAVTKDSNSSNSNSRDEVITQWKTKRRGGGIAPDIEDKLPVKRNWWEKILGDEDVEKLELGGKIVLLLDILKECSTIGDKVLVFSQSLLTLDLIEWMLSKDETSQASQVTINLDGTLNSSQEGETSVQQDVISSWVMGIDYFRMDGSTSADFRKKWIDLFNDKVYPQE